MQHCSPGASKRLTYTHSAASTYFFQGWIADVFLEGRPEGADFDTLLAIEHW